MSGKYKYFSADLSSGNSLRRAERCWFVRASLFYLLLFTILFPGCSNKQMRNFNAIPGFTGNYVNAVIEIPAGTNHRIKYNQEQRMFLEDPVEGGEMKIDFLPAPGNYGFVPGTFVDPAMGGGGDPVDILVISESLVTGTVIEVIPLLVLYFEDNKGFNRQLVDPTIIAVPADERKRVIRAASYEELFDRYPEFVDILISWFVAHEGQGPKIIKAIGDGEVAVNEIRKWETRRF